MVIESGKVVCPDNTFVEKIDCRADKFPHKNWKKLWQTITCDKETGLRCANENQGILTCFNYMVRFCCSEVVSPHPITTNAPPRKETKHPPKTVGPWTTLKNPEKSTTPRLTTAAEEEDCATGWSQWYDEQYPDLDNGGDEESYQKVTASGKVVCLADSSVEKIDCKAERFPNTPWEELGQTITCDKNEGLKCVNEDQGGLPCYNYKVRFCCSRAGGPPAPPITQAPTKGAPEKRPTAAAHETTKHIPKKTTTVEVIVPETHKQIEAKKPTTVAPKKRSTAAAHETTKNKPKKTPAVEEVIVPATHKQIEAKKPTTVASKKRSTAAAVKPTKSKTTTTTVSTTKKPEELESYKVQFTIINREFHQDLYNPEKPLYIEYARNITTEITKLFQKEQRARYLYREYNVSSFWIGSITVEGKCSFLKNGGENVPTLMKEFTEGTNNMTYLGPYRLRPGSLKVYVDKEVVYYTNTNTSSSPNRSLPYWVYFIIALCCLILLALIIAYIVLALVRYFKNRGDAYKVLKIPWGMYYPHLDLRKSF
ncbi:mucin-5AC-like isoform X2 [Lethenteron reissneri]|uniref:mucin-5AC-like isoform X2 n=1 Tax=Lethenteron reissneri TaxID=7753 RepID=UPI002AB7EC30|nr:mucin-5AC-like isoform X2 [Lethenteron reissneri]